MLEWAAGCEWRRSTNPTRLLLPGAPPASPVQVNGNPQKWAQNCFYLCAYSVLIQLVLVFAVPYFLGGESARSVAPGQKLRVLRSSHHLDGFQSELPFPPEL